MYNSARLWFISTGGRIDHGHHQGRAFPALNDTVAFSEAVQKAMDMTCEDDTLIVVTADHSLTFTMGGYPSINNPILGKIFQLVVCLLIYEQFVIIVQLLCSVARRKPRHTGS